MVHGETDSIRRFAPPETVSHPASLSANSPATRFTSALASTDHGNDGAPSIMLHRSSLSSRQPARNGNLRQIDWNTIHLELVIDMSKPILTITGYLMF